jgi:hypothetical protein
LKKTFQSDLAGFEKTCRRHFSSAETFIGVPPKKWSQFVAMYFRLGKFAPKRLNRSDYLSNLCREFQIKGTRTERKKERKKKEKH